MIEADIEPLFAAAVDESRQCETPSGCDEPAVWVVWASHHTQGCDMTGLRCGIHFNLLALEANRLVGAVSAGEWVNCGACGELLSSRVLSDYVRGIRL